MGSSSHASAASAVSGDPDSMHSTSLLTLQYCSCFCQPSSSFLIIVVCVHAFMLLTAVAAVLWLCVLQHYHHHHHPQQLISVAGRSRRQCSLIAQSPVRQACTAIVVVVTLVSACFHTLLATAGSLESVPALTPVALRRVSNVAASVVPYILQTYSRCPVTYPLCQTCSWKWPKQFHAHCTAACKVCMRVCTCVFTRWYAGRAAGAAAQQHAGLECQHGNGGSRTPQQQQDSSCSALHCMSSPVHAKTL